MYSIGEILDYGLFDPTSEGTSIAFIVYLASFIGIYKISTVIYELISFLQRQVFRKHSSCHPVPVFTIPDVTFFTV